MVNAISVNSVQKGFDPRDFSLVAFGGGGPLYGADIARELSIPRVIVPLASRHHLRDGAAGLRPQVRDPADGDGRGRRRPTRPRSRPSSRRWRPRAAQRSTSDGIAEGGPRVPALADCRYIGQAYELLVPLPPGPLDAAAHRARGRGVRGRPTSASTSTASEEPGADRAPALLRDRADADVSAERLERGQRRGRRTRRWSTAARCCSPTARSTRAHDTPFYDRSGLRAGNVIAGPAIDRAARLHHRHARRAAPRACSPTARS